MRKRVLIGITCLHQSANETRTEKLLLSPDYIRAVLQAGGVPVAVPMLGHPQERLALLEQLDGLILSGGDDYPGELYGEESHPRSVVSDPKRVAIEPEIARWALQRDIPILAVCMGIQTLGIVNGGRLIQDIPSWFERQPDEIRRRAVIHRHGEGLSPHFHDVTVLPGNLLHDIVDTERIEVNSYHHQALAPVESWETPCDAIQVVSWSIDGIIEGVVMPRQRWCVGIQWHPERLLDRSQHSALFKALVQEAGK